MPHRSQMRLILHGAIFLVIAMAVGGPGLWLALNCGFDQPVRQSLRQFHAILISTGIWMIATGAGLQLLELTSRGISWTVWTLVVSGYAFTLSLAVLLIGLWFYPAAASIPTQIEQIKALHWFGWINLVLILFSGLITMIPALLIIRGAFMAMRHSAIDHIQ